MMSNLYGVELSKVFDTMYQGFIDYKEEFEFYANQAIVCHAQNILEIGCGTGNLAHLFIKGFKSYLGLDLSAHMLQLAREKTARGYFMQADMRSFTTDAEYDMALITGRSSSYLLSDIDLLKTFDCISNALIDKGHLVFDCIDAEKFVPYVDENPVVTHHSNVGKMNFRRSSHWFIENRQLNLVNWKADYFKLEKNKEIMLGNDHVIFKAFTRQEITKLLEKASFEVISIVERPTYAFDTFVVHAQKLR